MKLRIITLQDDTRGRVWEYILCIPLAVASFYFRLKPHVYENSLSRSLGEIE
jgi:hypothetical protein